MEEVKPAVPRLALDLAQAYSQHGFRIWLVGGWVRDALLGEVHADLDFATDAPPQKSFEILKRWSGRQPWNTGIEFGTVGASRNETNVEVTTLRTEVYREDSRNPQITYTDDLSIDLSRRDFTINAMAITLPDLNLFDPFGGLKDLAERRIRTPLEPEISFGDDPLRMLRAFRFASTLDFQVDRKVLQAISRMRSRLQIVSRERVNEEFTKLMLGRRPSEALELAVESGLADEFIPELAALRLEQDPVHRHKDVFRHTVAVLARVCATDANEPDLALRLAAVFHDVGKPKTRKITPEGVTFYHHELVGAEMAESRLRELRYPARIISEVRELVALHMRFHTYRLGWTDRAVRRYVRDAGALLGKLNALVRADCTTRNPAKARELALRMDQLEGRIRELAAKEELSRLRPALDGHEVMEHLGIPSGPVVGEALQFLMELRLDEGPITKEETYRRLDEWWARRSGA